MISKPPLSQQGSNGPVNKEQENTTHGGRCDVTEQHLPFWTINLVSSDVNQTILEVYMIKAVCRQQF